MSQLKSLEAKLKLAQENHKDILPKYEKIQNELMSAAKKIEDIQSKIDEFKIKNGMADWNFLLEENGYGSTTKYNKRKEMLYELLECYGGGYYPEINQSVVQIKLIEGSQESLEKTYKGLLEILPFIKVHPKYNRKVIDIFENSLSQYGCYDLHVNEEENKYELAFTYRDPKEFPSLMDALKYIQKNHWYKKLKKDDEEEYNDL